LGRRPYLSRAKAKAVAQETGLDARYLQEQVKKLAHKMREREQRKHRREERYGWVRDIADKEARRDFKMMGRILPLAEKLLRQLARVGKNREKEAGR